MLLDPRTGRPTTELVPGVTVEDLIEEQGKNWVYHWHNIHESNDPTAMDGAFYHDTRQPFTTFDQAQVTLATTDKALYPAAAFPVLGSNYFGFAGKRVHIRAFGKITTLVTPGNGTIDLYWGSGADATGTIIASSAAQTLVASQTNISWRVELTVHARTLGATGGLFCHGFAIFGTAVVAAGTFLIPASAAVVTTADTTANNVLSLQFKRSGSTAEVMTCQDLEVHALN